MITSNLQEIKHYLPARLYEGKEVYVAYYAYNPVSEKLERKRIKVNHISKKSEQKKYALQLIKRINESLANGWNPFFEERGQNQYKRLSEAAAFFLKVMEKRKADGSLRSESFKDFKSNIGTFDAWVQQKYGDIYLYKLDKRIVTEFLDYIYLERGRTPQTRNNYLNNLRTFAGFLVDKDFMPTRFTDGVSNIRKGDKQRTVISEKDLTRIWDYLDKHDKYFLLACKMEYYTFIRPRELSFLKISHLSFSNNTILLPSGITKNRKEGLVTLPDYLILMMVDLGIHTYPSDSYVFGQGCKPSSEHASSKQFRDKWNKLRKALKLPDSYKFYSLKDTGITEMLRRTGDPVLVKNQARHSDISITNKYTPAGMKEADQRIKKMK